ncbi:MAG: class I SAM-dependent methyltransferase [Bacteroidales bacterium]|nr:class I SAM-dependent methyltransferase [Bacteroidales bacterium]
MKDGGYDIGYKTCQSFWGDNPGSLLMELEDVILNYENLRVLDLGCGEGKNAVYLAKKGCFVDAIDISKYAISNATAKVADTLNINIEQCDARSYSYTPNKYDIIIAYGLFHCFDNKVQVDKVIEDCISSLVNGGFLILCAFNSRKHDLTAHPGFNPLLLNHGNYLRYFKKFNIVFESDEDLFETHPHNNIPHMHSMTRLIIQKNELP